jgi:hypothetical protein
VSKAGGVQNIEDLLDQIATSASLRFCHHHPHYYGVLS